MSILNRSILYTYNTKKLTQNIMLLGTLEFDDFKFGQFILIL